MSDARAAFANAVEPSRLSDAIRHRSECCAGHVQNSQTAAAGSQAAGSRWPAKSSTASRR